MESGCTRADVEVKRLEISSSGGMLWAWGRCRKRGLEVGMWRCRDLEVRCKRADVEAKRYGDPELGRHAAGLGTWRCLPQELWRFDAGVASKEVWRSGGVLRV